MAIENIIQLPTLLAINGLSDNGWVAVEPALVKQGISSKGIGRKPPLKVKDYAPIDLSAESYHAVREVAERAFPQEAAKCTGLFRSFGYVMGGTVSTLGSGYATSQLIQEKQTPSTFHALGLTSGIKVITSFETARMGWRQYREGVRVNSCWNRFLGMLTGVRSGLEALGGSCSSAAIGLMLSNVRTQAARQALPVLSHAGIGASIASAAVLGMSMLVGAGRAIRAHSNLASFRRKTDDARETLEYLKDEIRLTATDCANVRDKLFGEKGISYKTFANYEKSGAFENVLKETRYSLKGELDALNSQIKRDYYMHIWIQDGYLDVEALNAVSDETILEIMESGKDALEVWRERREIQTAVEGMKKTWSAHLIDFVMQAIPDSTYKKGEFVEKARDMLFMQLLQKSEQKYAIAKAAYPSAIFEEIIEEIETGALAKGACAKSEKNIRAFVDKVSRALLKEITSKLFWGAFFGIVTAVSYLVTVKVALFEQILLLGASVLSLALDCKGLFSASRKMTPDFYDKLKMLLINLIVAAAVVTTGVLTAGVVPLAVTAAAGALMVAINGIVAYNQRHRAKMQSA